MSRNDLRLCTAGLEGVLEGETSISAREADLEDIETDLVVSFRLERSGAEILISGAVKAFYRTECHLCLGPARIEINERFDRTEPWGAEDVDIIGDVRDSFLTSLPIKVKCSSHCRGLCPSCGANLNSDSCKCPPRRPDGALKHILDEAIERCKA